MTNALPFTSSLVTKVQHLPAKKINSEPENIPTRTTQPGRKSVRHAENKQFEYTKHKMNTPHEKQLLNAQINTKYEILRSR